MSKTKAAVLGIIGSVLLFFFTLLDVVFIKMQYNLLLSLKYLSSNQVKSIPPFLTYIIMIFSLITLIGSIIILKKQRLGGIITLLGGILIIIYIIAISIYYSIDYTPIGTTIPGPIIFPLALIFVFIAAFMAIFSKAEKLQAGVKPVQKLILQQDIKRVRDIGIIGGIIAFILSIVLLFFVVMAKAMSGYSTELGLFDYIQIIFSIIIVIISIKIENNTRIKSIALIILSAISLYLNFFNIAFIATLIAGILGLRTKNN